MTTYTAVAATVGALVLAGLALFGRPLRDRLPLPRGPPCRRSLSPALRDPPQRSHRRLHRLVDDGGSAVWRSLVAAADMRPLVQIVVVLHGARDRLLLRRHHRRRRRCATRKKLDVATSGISAACGEAYQVTGIRGRPTAAISSTLESTALSAAQKLASVLRTEPRLDLRGGDDPRDRARQRLSVALLPAGGGGCCTRLGHAPV